MCQLFVLFHNTKKKKKSADASPLALIQISKKTQTKRERTTTTNRKEGREALCKKINHAQGQRFVTSEFFFESNTYPATLYLRDITLQFPKEDLQTELWLLIQISKKANLIERERERVEKKNQSCPRIVKAC